MSFNISINNTFYANNVTSFKTALTNANSNASSQVILSPGTYNFGLSDYTVESTLTGTIQIFSGFDDIFGTGTSFTTEVQVGQQIRIGNFVKVVTSVANNVVLFVNSNYDTDASGLTGEIVRLFDVPENTNVQGSESGSTTLIADNTFTGVLFNLGIGLSNITIQNIDFDGNNQNRTVNDAAIYTTNNNNINIINCSFQNIENTNFKSTNNVSAVIYIPNITNLLIKNCKFNTIEPNTTVISGLNSTSISNVRIDNNNFTSGNLIINLRLGNRVIISSNIITNCTSTAINIDGGNNTTITSNNIASCITSISCLNCDIVNVTDNTINIISGTAIVANGSVRNVVIADNLIENTVTGISLGFTINNSIINNSTISGNIINQCNTGINLTRSAMIAGNTIKVNDPITTNNVLIINDTATRPLIDIQMANNILIGNIDISNKTALARFSIGQNTGKNILTDASSINGTLSIVELNATISLGNVTMADLPIECNGHQIQITLLGVGDFVLVPANISGTGPVTFSTAGNVATLQWNGTSWDVISLLGATVPAVELFPQVSFLQEQQAQGVNAGNASPNGFDVRVLSIIIAQPWVQLPGATDFIIDGSTFPGVYLFEFSAPNSDVGGAQASLVIFDTGPFQLNVVELMGSSNKTFTVDPLDTIGTRSFGCHVETITISRTAAVRTYQFDSFGTRALGEAADRTPQIATGIEIYAQVKITRLHAV